MSKQKSRGPLAIGVLCLGLALGVFISNKIKPNEVQLEDKQRKELESAGFDKGAEWGYLKSNIELREGAFFAEISQEQEKRVADFAKMTGRKFTVENRQNGDNVTSVFSFEKK
jgi:hypothetical protein